MGHTRHATYIDAIRTFAMMTVLVNNKGGNMLAIDENVVLQIEGEIDSMGKLLEDSVHVSFWEEGGDKITFAFPEGDNTMAIGVEGFLYHQIKDAAKNGGDDLSHIPPSFLLYHSLCGVAQAWFVEQMYPIVRDRSFPIPRSFGANMLVSDHTGESLHIWQNDDRPFSESMWDAAHATLHSTVGA